MLINAKIKNFASFKDEVSINFEAGRETKFSKYLPVLKKFRKKILPVSCFFGPNAAGKTNFLNALDCLHRMVFAQEDRMPEMPITPFLLDKEHKNSPTEFELSFVTANNTCFVFRLTVTKQEVLSESLSIINTIGERPLYIRKQNHFELIANVENEKKIIIKAMFAATPKHQLFLNITRKTLFEQNWPELIQVLQWFDHLVLITPETKFLPVWGAIDQLKDILSELDLGVDDICLRDYPAENIPVDLQNSAKNLVRDNRGLGTYLNGDFVFALFEKGSLVYKKLCALHRLENGESVEFSFKSESDGTKRILELAPVIYSLLHSLEMPRVFMIDELDRSLHTLLTKYIVKSFIKKSSPDTRVQLLFTCHDALMIDSDTFRRDEMYVVSKENGTTQIKNFYEINGTRSDSSLRKMYLNGELGGIPGVKNIEL